MNHGSARLVQWWLRGGDIAWKESGIRGRRRTRSRPRSVIGLLVDPDAPRAFAGAILQLAGSDVLRRRLRAGERQAALQRTWERSLLELRDAYRTLVAPRPPHVNRLAA